MLARLWHRLRQFYFGMFSRYKPEDEAFVRAYLSPKELSLFNMLPGFEKKHAVVVAGNMLKLAAAHPDLDAKKLARLGLFHDIGKVGELNSIYSKSILVIIRFFFPKLYARLAKRGETNLRWRRFYIHKHHGAVGAKMLEKLGISSDIISIINKHDPRIEPFGPQDPIELKLLRQADSY